MSEFDELNKVVSKLFYEGKHFGEIVEEIFDIWNELEDELEETIDNDD